MKFFTLKSAFLTAIISLIGTIFTINHNNKNDNQAESQQTTNQIAKVEQTETSQIKPTKPTLEKPVIDNFLPKQQQANQPQILGEWVEAYNFATDKRNEDRDGFAGIEPIISKAPWTCTPSNKLIKLGKDCNEINKADYYTPNSAFKSDTWIDAQVFVPKHRKGEKLPVILHSHGYGSSKLAELKEIPKCDPKQQPYDCPLGENEGMKRFQGMFEQTTKLLTEMVNKGYIVISYSQRGFGESEGDIMMMNPYHETQDGIAVLDWIAKQGKQGNLPIAVDENNNFKVGLLGGSYGGGFQFPLASLDTRIDTIVPIGTWNSITRSLMPNGVTKGGWGNLLCMMSMGKNQNHYVRDVCRRIANTSIRTQQQIDPNHKISDYVAQTGLSYFEHLEKNNLAFREGEPPFKQRPIDALLIQGLRDVLFDGEEVTRNYQYLKSAGGDVRMLTNQSGHISPFANQNSAGTMNCGKTDMFRAIRIWFDVKLRGMPKSMLNEIPKMCMSLDNNSAINLAKMPDKDNSKVVTKSFNLQIGNLRSPIKCQPIHTVEKDSVLAGRVQLQNLIVRDDTLVKAGVAYMGLCLQRDGKTRLIDDVITGYPTGYQKESNFVTVAEQLKKGDKIGIMGFKDHVQMFAFGGSFVPNISALVVQDFRPGDHKNSTLVDETLPNSDWASAGLFSINAFTAMGEISLPILDNPTVHTMKK